MKKLLCQFILALMILTFAIPSWATPYYAGGLAGQNINYTSSAGWYPTSTGSCTGSGTPVTIGNFANGDILNANGCTGITVNVDPGSVSVTVNLSTVGTGGTAGGTFLYTTTASPPATVHANCTAGSTNCLSVSGLTGSTGTITGICTGSATGSYEGCHDTHSQAAGTMHYGAGLGGDGSSSAAGIDYNYSVTGTPVIVDGNCTASATASKGIGCYANSAVMTVNGDCIASGNTGCFSDGTGGLLTATGNIIGSATNVGAKGAVSWVPSAASKYFKMLTASGAFLYLSAGLGNVGGSFLGNAATQKSSIATTAYFVGPDSTNYTQGTASAGGGGCSTGY